MYHITNFIMGKLDCGIVWFKYVWAKIPYFTILVYMAPEVIHLRKGPYFTTTRLASHYKPFSELSIYDHKWACRPGRRNRPAPAS